MKVYLLNVRPDAEAGRPLFYPEPPPPEPEGPDPNAPRAPGFRGWAVAKLTKFRDAWKHSQGWLARVGRDVWEWLHRRTHPDEPLLARLRGEDRIAIYHPSSMDPEKARADWAGFLRRARIRHWAWFAVNLVISPLTILLAPLPGPNLIGYWFCYRAIHHWLILSGLSRARQPSTETSLHPSKALDKPFATADLPGDVRVDPAHLSTLGCNPDVLNDFLERHGLLRDHSASEGQHLS